MRDRINRAPRPDADDGGCWLPPTDTLKLLLT